ncbi:RING finger protein 10-like [Pelomyxa schiedti]|nr:RING finger protein 10-like [Pelomyxa schiedti]
MSEDAHRRDTVTRERDGGQTHRTKNRHTKKLPVETGNYLLNFRLPQIQKPSSGRRRMTVPRRNDSTPYNKGKFIHANYRFVIKSDHSDLITNPDTPVDWEDVEAVVHTTHTNYECPICLDSVVAPRASLCGHIFCLACIIRYFSYGATPAAGTCPLCTETIMLNEMKSSIVSVVQKYSAGDKISFILLFRSQQSTIPVPLQYWEDSSHGQHIPRMEEPFQQYSRFTVGTHKKNILEEEERQILVAIQEAETESDPSLEFLMKALNNIRTPPVRKPRCSSQIPGLEECDEDEISSSSDETIAPTTAVETPKEFPVNAIPLYQETSGQLIFLHPLNLKMLYTEFGSNVSQQLTAPIIEIEEIIQNEESRRLYPVTSHLPLTCSFAFAELDLSGLVSPPTIHKFASELAHRQSRRQHRQAEHEKVMARAQRPLCITYPKAAIFSGIMDDRPIFSSRDFPEVGRIHDVGSAQDHDKGDTGKITPPTSTAASTTTTTSANDTVTPPAEPTEVKMSFAQAVRAAEIRRAQQEEAALEQEASATVPPEAETVKPKPVRRKSPAPRITAEKPPSEHPTFADILRSAPKPKATSSPSASTIITSPAPSTSSPSPQQPAAPLSPTILPASPALSNATAAVPRLAPTPLSNPQAIPALSPPITTSTPKIGTTVITASTIKAGTTTTLTPTSTSTSTTTNTSTSTGSTATSAAANTNTPTTAEKINTSTTPISSKKKKTPTPTTQHQQQSKRNSRRKKDQVLFSNVRL